MSLGRLLRRASSKASDLLTLRYITPESSPVRKAPRPRRRRTTSLGALYQPSPTEPRPPLIPKDEDILVVVQNTQDTAHISPTDEDGEKLAQGPEVDGALSTSQPVHSDSGILSTVSSQDGTEDGREPRPEAVEEEGSLELSADGVSRDSSFDSDSDAFSSPFCLSPISAALAEGNSSAFLESEGRQAINCWVGTPKEGISSPSSSDANLRFPDSNGLLQTPRWDEPQRGCALEQICGVFRVDLGHMRSLRLFFSDEACTSGQLVVASRESQYKIFHFHHGGLDKLSEVFQQWKFCTETHLRDQQVTDERTCMQFSIRRPKLPSSEIHPEESLYRRLDVSAWLNHLNDLGQVEEEYKLRQAIFFGGIDVSIRGEVWPFLLHYYSHESTSEEREALRSQKRKEYAAIQQKRRILLNYAVYNPAIGYSQGMSDLVAPILAEVLDESDTFWCFVGLMQNTIFVSSPRDEDMERQLLYLRELLRLTHQRFYQHLVSLGEDGLQMLFCHRWLLLCFKREFPEAEALRIWEACWAHYQTDYFHLFICVAIVAIYGDDVIEQQLATDQMLLHFGNLAMHMNGELVLRKARSLLYQFRLLPRIPCSLHDLWFCHFPEEPPLARREDSQHCPSSLQRCPQTTTSATRLASRILNGLLTHRLMHAQTLRKEERDLHGHPLLRSCHEAI